LDITPDDAQTHYNLGMALVLCGQYREAAVQYRETLNINPDCVDACTNLAILLSTCPETSVRDGAQALTLAERSVQLSNGQAPTSFDALAAAYAEVGRFPEAVQAIRMAMDLAARQNKLKLAETFSKKLQIYYACKPFRMPPPKKKEIVSQSQP
jgi:Flp pilus assembly protein TadD